MPTLAAAMAVKAEILFGLRVTMRHRAPRLAILMVALGAVAARGAPPFPWVIALAGTLGSVVGSRPLAPGSAIEAGLAAGARWGWIAGGRFLGASTLVGPGSAVLAAVLVGAPDSMSPLAAPIGVSTGLAALAWAMALSPVAGATATAMVGTALSWIPVLSPADSAIGHLFADRSPTAGLSVWGGVVTAAGVAAAGAIAPRFAARAWS